MVVTAIKIEKKKKKETSGRIFRRTHILHANLTNERRKLRRYLYGWTRPPFMFLLGFGTLAILST